MCTKGFWDEIALRFSRIDPAVPPGTSTTGVLRQTALLPLIKARLIGNRNLIIQHFTLNCSTGVPFAPQLSRKDIDHEQGENVTRFEKMDRSHDFERRRFGRVRPRQ